MEEDHYVTLLKRVQEQPIAKEEKLQFIKKSIEFEVFVQYLKSITADSIVSDCKECQDIEKIVD